MWGSEVLCSVVSHKFSCQLYLLLCHVHCLTRPDVPASPSCSLSHSVKFISNHSDVLIRCFHAIKLQKCTGCEGDKDLSAVLQGSHAHFTTWHTHLSTQHAFQDSMRYMSPAGMCRIACLQSGCAVEWACPQNGHVIEQTCHWVGVSSEWACLRAGMSYNERTIEWACNWVDVSAKWACHRVGVSSSISSGRVFEPACHLVGVPSSGRVFEWACCVSAVHLQVGSLTGSSAPDELLIKTLSQSEASEVHDRNF